MTCRRRRCRLPRLGRSAGSRGKWWFRASVPRGEAERDLVAGAQIQRFSVTRATAKPMPVERHTTSKFAGPLRCLARQRCPRRIARHGHIIVRVALAQRRGLSRRSAWPEPSVRGLIAHSQGAGMRWAFVAERPVVSTRRGRVAAANGCSRHGRRGGLRGGRGRRRRRSDRNSQIPRDIGIVLPTSRCGRWTQAEARPRDPRPLATDQDRRDASGLVDVGKDLTRVDGFAETIPRETSARVLQQSLG